MKSCTNQKGVGEFLGMIGYYSKIISRFPDATRPMTKLIRKDIKFEWCDDCQSDFENLKLALLSLPSSHIKNPQKRHVVFTDASDQAAAAALTQEYKDDDSDIKDMSIAFLSSQFSDT